MTQAAVLRTAEGPSTPRETRLEGKEEKENCLMVIYEGYGRISGRRGAGNC
jgi:hypothetical protein